MPKERTAEIPEKEEITVDHEINGSPGVTLAIGEATVEEEGTLTPDNVTNPVKEKNREEGATVTRKEMVIILNMSDFVSKKRFKDMKAF